jgi:hypothetical protein
MLTTLVAFLLAAVGGLLSPVTHIVDGLLSGLLSNLPI